MGQDAPASPLSPLRSRRGDSLLVDGGFVRVFRGSLFNGKKAIHEATRKALWIGFVNIADEVGEAGIRPKLFKSWIDTHEGKSYRVFFFGFS